MSAPDFENVLSRGDATAYNSQHSPASAVADFGRAVAYSGLVEPVNGLVQLGAKFAGINVDKWDFLCPKDQDSWTAKTGAAIGTGLDFWVLNAVSHGGAAKCAAGEGLATVAPLFASVKRAATVGALYQTIAMPLANPQGSFMSFASQRAKNGIVGGVTFASLDGASRLLPMLPGMTALAAESPMVARGLVGALSGVPGGISSAEAQSLVFQHKLTTNVGGSVRDFSVIGGVLGVLPQAGGQQQEGSRNTRLSQNPPAGAPGPESELRSMTRLEPSVGAAKSKSYIQLLPIMWDRSCSTISPDIDGRYVDRLPPLTDRAQKVESLKADVSKIDQLLWPMPTASKGKFVPETATKMDAALLELEGHGWQSRQSNRKVNQVIQIKRDINDNGQPAAQYLARVIRNSDITIIGEEHTYDLPNPHRLLGTKVISALPAGSILAVEVAASMKPIFEAFNRHKGSDMRVPYEIANNLSLQRPLSILRAIHVCCPDLVDMWKSARDKGIRVVPIDVSTAFTTEDYNLLDSREAQLSRELLALHSQSKSKPVVAWFGCLHAARTTESGIPTLAQRISASPEFASGRSKLSTVHGQISSTPLRKPLQVIMRDLSAPVAMPTSKAGLPWSVGMIPFLQSYAAEASQTYAKLSAFDHVIMYPPATNAIAQYYSEKQIAHDH